MWQKWLCLGAKLPSISKAISSLEYFLKCWIIMSGCRCQTCLRVCARLNLRSFPHRYKRNFFPVHVFCCCQHSNPFWAKVTLAEEERKNTVNSGHFFLPAMAKDSACHSL